MFFGEMLGNDVSQFRRTISPNQMLLEQWRAAGLRVIYTRENHCPDLSDLSLSKKIRGRNTMCIGDHGPIGRILVRGEPGHDIVPELYALPGEDCVGSYFPSFQVAALDMIKAQGDILGWVIAFK